MSTGQSFMSSAGMELIYQIRKSFCFEPTFEQGRAIETFCQFMTDQQVRRKGTDSVMIMRGSAGTGKTSLASAIVRTLVRLKQKVVLMAPTGRAAKVFSQNSGQQAFTIHRKIYRQKMFTGDLTGFNLNDNMHSDTLFLIDEASMVSNGYANATGNEYTFGSGHLLNDLVRYVYNGKNCRMMLIGDKAQLPPVGEEESLALRSEEMCSFGLEVYDCDLNEVLRQSEQSGILYNATRIRQMITLDKMTQLPKIRFHCFADIHIVPGNELVEQLNTSYSQVGIDETIVITRSNKRANIFNVGIRNTILDREDKLCTGDQLMIVKNNYYWVKHEKETADTFSFIANGDRTQVVKVRNVHELYGFNFAEVTMLFPDYDDYELTATVILDSLTTEAPALTAEQNEHLFMEVMADYADVPTKTERMKCIKDDRYFNAIQVKYAYAVTCHKAQGGQWAHVYIDQGYMTDDMLTSDYIHWLYTAFTRATEKLYLVNWPKTQVWNEEGGRSEKG